MEEYAFKLDNNNMTLAVSGDLDNHKWDPTGGVEGWFTLYYMEDGTKYLVTKVSGTWLIHDSGDSIKDRTAIAVCNDKFFSNQYMSKSVSTNSFNIPTGFTRYADSTQGIVGIAGKSVCTIYRTQQPGTTWKLEVPIIIAGSIPTI